MNDSIPPTLSYHPEAPNPFSFGQFFFGLLFGGGAAWMSAVAGVVILFGMYGESGRQPAISYAVPFIGPALVIAIGLLLTRRSRAKSFGIGLIASVPLAALATFVICGGLR